MRDFASLPFRSTARPTWYGPFGYLAALLGVGLATGLLWLADPFLSLGSVYLVYLVVVVAVAVGWGLKQGILASVLAFLAANFFFIQPLYTFTIADPQDVLALVIFLALATLTSQLVARLRQEAQDARRSQQFTTTLYSLSQTINRQHSLQPLLEETCQQLCAALKLEACTIRLRNALSSRLLTAHSGELLAEEETNSMTVRTPLKNGDQTLGLLLAQFPSKRHITTEEQQLIAAFAEQLQVAAERARLQQVEIQTEVLRRTDELRAELLSAVAHDLRSPLGSIKTAATSLLSPRLEWSTKEQQEFLKAIVGEVDHLNRMVANLLDMSRIEEGRLHPQKEAHTIDDAIAGVLERLRPRLAEHPASVSIEENLPQVPFDKVEIDEVLTNLIENALKYTPPGTPIGVRAGRSDDNIEVEVWDEGPGVPAEHIANLFSRFYRVQASAPGMPTGVQGTGLGLSIAKGIVEAHGGWIKAMNRPLGGMSFSFTLPIHPTEATGETTQVAHELEEPEEARSSAR